jgi:hypothetical protein
LNKGRNGVYDKHQCSTREHFCGGLGWLMLYRKSTMVPILKEDRCEFCTGN